MIYFTPTMLVQDKDSQLSNFGKQLSYFLGIINHHKILGKAMYLNPKGRKLKFRSSNAISRTRAIYGLLPKPITVSCKLEKGIGSNLFDFYRVLDKPNHLNNHMNHILLQTFPRNNLPYQRSLILVESISLATSSKSSRSLLLRTLNITVTKIANHQHKTTLSKQHCRDVRQAQKVPTKPQRIYPITSIFVPILSQEQNSR